MQPRRSLAAIAVTVMTLGLSLLGISPAQADTQDFYFTNYNATYLLDRTPQGHAQAQVTETFTAQFPNTNQNHGILRYLPLRYQNIDTPITITSVTNQGGEPYQYTTDKSIDQLELKIGNPNAYLQGSQTFILKYTVMDPVRDFPTTHSEEFYWNTNGFGWDQSFGRATAVVKVSNNLRAAQTGDYACYYGVVGSTTKCEMSYSTDTYTAAASRILMPHENLTVAVGFKPGTFTIPAAPLWRTILSTMAQVFASMSFFIGFAIVSVTALIAGVVYKQHVRYRTPTIVAEYNAPDERDLFAINNVLQELREQDINTNAATAFSASILKMAIQKNITLMANDGDLQFIVNNRDGLLLSEGEILDTFAAHRTGPAYSLQITDTGLASSLRKIGKNTGIQQGYLVTGKYVPWYFRFLRAAIRIIGFLGAATTFAAVFIGAATGPVFPNTVLPIVGYLAIVFLIPRGIANLNKTSLTPTGKTLADHMNGLNEYIKVAERDRIAFLQSVQGAVRQEDGTGHTKLVLFEQLLPYAVLLGLEKSWAQTLDALYEQYDYQPTWNQTHYQTAYLTGVVTHDVGTTYSYTPPSSSSGGSGGGGFSGGGGGGGGGGGW